MADDAPRPSAEDLINLYESLAIAVDSTTASLKPLIARAKTSDESLQFSSGLSLLLLRPTLLLSSIHRLILLLGLHLSLPPRSIPTPSSTDATTPYSAPRDANVVVATPEEAEREMLRELREVREVMEKVKGLEGKVAYQVKKLVGLARSQGEVKKSAEGEDAEDDLTSFKPNPSALLVSKPSKDSPRPARRARSVSDDNASSSDGDAVYRPPKLASVPYTGETRANSRRTERRAPALLSEFANSLSSAPVLESTSGLSVRPAMRDGDGGHSNSTSTNRLAELSRMTEFEEENMMRLVMTKREQKRREEDEAALMMGFGVGGGSRSRSRRQGGFEAELEGVLGGRGSGKGVWDGVGGGREGVLERSRKRKGEEVGAEGGRVKKGKFGKAVKRSRRG